MTPHHVAWATDKAYLPHAATSIVSVLSRDELVAAHLFVAPDIGRTDRWKLSRLGERFGGRLSVHPCGPELTAGLPSVPGISAVMWVRVHLPHLLSDVDRVLYLDADTVAVDSVDELFSIDLQGSAVAAVDNVTEPGRRDFCAELGLAAGQRYFNSGVLVMDLEQMRRRGTTQALLDQAQATAWPDQDALNVVLGPTRHHLHPRWNAQNSLFFWRELADDVLGRREADEARTNPAILHFEGHGPGTKPWDDRCAHPRRRDYLAHAHSVPWVVVPDSLKRLRRLVRQAVRR